MYDNPTNPQLRRVLRTLIDRLRFNGTILILDIERHYEASDGVHGPADPRVGGRKARGYGSKEAMLALEALGMSNVAASKDHKFHWKPTNEEERAVSGPDGRLEMYYIVRADKGLGFAETMKTSCTWCGKNPNNTGAGRLKRCARCSEDVWYCRKKCQREDRNIHRKTCSQV